MKFHPNFLTTRVASLVQRRLLSSLFLAVLSGSSCLSGCSGYSLTGGPGKVVAPSLISSSSSRDALREINSILLLPIEVDRQKSSREGGVAAQLSPALVQQAADDLAERFSVETGVQVQRVHDVLRLPASRELNPEQVQQALAKATASGVSAVLVTRLHSYIEREGSAMGTEVAAHVHVSFAVIPIAATAAPLNAAGIYSQKAAWEASYNFRDQALSENLFRLHKALLSQPAGQKGLRWHNAATLLRLGFAEAARDFSERRTQAFLRTE
jgi:hypothetical protein